MSTERLSPRDMARHCARVYLAEARRRRPTDPSFAATLLQWAKNARNRSNADASPPINELPLFRAVPS